MRNQAWTRPPALDRQRQHWRLHDGLAGPATQLRPDMLDHLETGWGTYSSTSRSSCPIRLNVVPPQPAQMQAGSWVTVSRGRWAGNGARTGCLRWCPGRRLGVGRHVGFGCAGAGVFGGSILFERADQQVQVAQYRD